jgi:prepilin-type N-terminal cleavage/methylation domain-containing protein
MKISRTSDPEGFTLLEVIVSTAIISLLVVLLLGLVSQTQKTWTYANGRIEQFRSARDAFDAITRRLETATLNTYLDYDNPTNPTSVMRCSNLRFLSGPTASILGSTTVATNLPWMSVFFQTPGGFATNTTNAPLRDALNTWGYYLEYAPDYRLMEMMQPTESLSVYARAAGNPGYTNVDWVTDALCLPSASRPCHVLAENVVALILLPKLPPSSLTPPYTTASLAPSYTYDSSRKDAQSSDPNLNPHHQLPPVVQVTLVAVDEESALRKGAVLGGITNAVSGLFQNSANLTNDLASLETYLHTNGVSYRIFTTDVMIRGAKWSMTQTN